MSATHVILGSGGAVTSPRSVINEAFKDAVREGDTISMPWMGKPSDAMAYVYDYVLDNEVNFLLLHDFDTTPPAPFVESERGEVLRVLDITKAMSDHVNRGDGGQAFVLGEDDATEAIILDFAKYSDVPMKDLSNGLIPVNVMETHPDNPGQEEVDPTDDTPEEGVAVIDAALTYSIEELRNLPVPALKRVAQVTGLDPLPPTQEEILDAMVAYREGKIVETMTGKQETDSAIEYFGGSNPSGIPTQLAAIVLELKDNTPSRENSLVITKLQEALLWYHYGSEV